MYNPKSKNAADFIDDKEILDTLAYADAHKDDIELVNRLIDKTNERKGLTHREAAVLLACDDPEAIRRILSHCLLYTSRCV